jgi:hypothetical protein
VSNPTPEPRSTRTKPKSGLGSTLTYIIVGAVCLAVGIAISANMSSVNSNATERAATDPPKDTVAPAVRRQVAVMQGCEVREDLTDGVEQEIIEQFEIHAKAHHDYVMKKIAFGDAENPAPGTVRWVWRETLAKRKELVAYLGRLEATTPKECK